MHPADRCLLRIEAVAAHGEDAAGHQPHGAARGDGAGYFLKTGEMLVHARGGSEAFQAS
jgi:hypothetical protein